VQRRCATLRRENTVLASGIPIVDVNSQGEKVYMDDATRERRLADLASQLRSCP
jgi:DICT domain-containing protein